MAFWAQFIILKKYRKSIGTHGWGWGKGCQHIMGQQYYKRTSGCEKNTSGHIRWFWFLQRLNKETMRNQLKKGYFLSWMSEWNNQLLSVWDISNSYTLFRDSSLNDLFVFIAAQGYARASQGVSELFWAEPWYIIERMADPAYRKGQGM